MTKERREIRIPTKSEIIAIRLALDMDQSKLAELVGVSQGQWSAWERGHRRPSRQSAMLIEANLIPLVKKSRKKKS